MTVSYRVILQEHLIEAGVLGMGQQEITILMRNMATGEMIRDELTRLHKKGLIQKFIVPSPRQGGPPRTVWRGTTALTSYLIGGGNEVDSASDVS
jgi:hypothetical protein